MFVSYSRNTEIAELKSNGEDINHHYKDMIEPIFFKRMINNFLFFCKFMLLLVNNNLC